MLSYLPALVRIAFANIFSSALNIFVGLVLLFGSAVLVIGGSLFSTLDTSLSRSIVDSITGHVQVYGARSKDPLEIYGKVDGSDSNLSPIDDFKGLKAKLLALPNVERVVPMGGATALVGSGNTIDVTLEKLRALYRAKADGTSMLSAEDFNRQSLSLQQHVRNMVRVLSKDVEREAELTDGTGIEPRQKEALTTASTDEFWAGFEADAFGHLELLENRVAPLVSDADLVFMRCLGTDLDAYQASFARVAVVEGKPVPKGHRGVLLPRFFAEEFFKLKNARRLDKIRDARAAGRSLADETDKDLQRFVRENKSQTREIVLQLDGIGTQTAVTKLQQLLSSKEEDLAGLLTSFFSVTDENFDARYAFFYKELAPLLNLYRTRVGDVLTLRSFGRSGSLNTVQVRVYGIFEVRGLEKSPLAGANALIDMVSFRDLYGFLSAEKKAELEVMKQQVNAKQVDRADAESALFGDESELVKATEATKIDVGAQGLTKKAQQKDTFDESEIDEGVVLHAAVLLKDGSGLQQQAALEAIEGLLKGSKPPPASGPVEAAAELIKSGRLPLALNAAAQAVVALEEQRVKGTDKPSSAALLDLQAALKTERPTLAAEDTAVLERLAAGARPAVWVVSWSSAAGFLGKFIDFFRLLLVAIILAFAFIALIVVTLGMTIATLQRTTTIGTMRAIGAQRSFVITLVLMETLALAATFGAAGAGVGAAVVGWLHHRGIPAFRDELYFFFSGPVLRPELTAMGVGLAVGVTLVVSLLAVAFPTYLATRVAPVTAMQATE